MWKSLAVPATVMWIVYYMSLGNWEDYRYEKLSQETYLFAKKLKKEKKMKKIVFSLFNFAFIFFVAGYSTIDYITKLKDIYLKKKINIERRCYNA